MIELGLGYLKLGQMSMNLSGGEAQRVKLAKALSSSSYGKNLYILDEPTSGLNDVDIDKFIQVLFSLQKNGETAIIIEHNVEFIKRLQIISLTLVYPAVNPVENRRARISGSSICQQSLFAIPSG